MPERVAGAPVQNKPKLLEQVRNIIRLKYYRVKGFTSRGFMG
jgi:hypothetical protein